MTGCLLKRHGLVQPQIFGLGGGITGEIYNLVVQELNKVRIFEALSFMLLWVCVQSEYMH